MSAIQEFAVTGMSCGHCESAIRQEVGALAGVTGVDVSAATGRLAVTTDQPVTAEQIIAAVDEAGYDAVPA